MKGNNMSKKYTIEEIVDAIDLSCGDSGKTSKEVISILETDVEKNTEDYLKGKGKGFNYKGQFITNPFISPCGRFDVNPKKYYGLTEEQAKQYREEKNNGTI